MRNYIALLGKIDAFVLGLRTCHPQAFACAPGCADCCAGGIKVWRVERDNILNHSKSRQITAAINKPATGRCKWLDSGERCEIYDARPVVCRLWGAPLLFAGETEHEDSIHLSHEAPVRNIPSKDGLITCCEKNFASGAESSDLAERDMVDARIVLSTLAAINHVYCKGIGTDPSERFSIESIVDDTEN